MNLIIAVIVGAILGTVFTNLVDTIEEHINR